MGFRIGVQRVPEEELPEWDFLEESHGLAEQADDYANCGDNRYKGAEEEDKPDGVSFKVSPPAPSIFDPDRGPGLCL